MRKDDIYNYVKQQTRQLIETNSLDNNGIDAQMIALDLKLNRANVSKDLNKLWKEGKIIKIISRPILFLDYFSIVNHYSLDFIPITIEKNDLISNHIIKAADKDKSAKSVQNHSISLDGSLEHQFNKLKAALSYPPYGLSTVLIGETGVGKSHLSKEAYKYTVENNFKNENSKFISIECQNFTSEDNLFNLQLFGAAKGAIPLSADKFIRGSLESSNKGVVYLNNVDKLNPVSLNILLEVIKTKTFFRIGENKPRNLDTTLILAANNNSREINHLKQYVSNDIYIPNIDDRNIIEKIEFILHFFCKEAMNTNLSIVISKDILFSLATYTYSSNLIQMHSEITQICSKTYLTAISNTQPVININLSDLPVSMLEQKSSQIRDVDKVHRILKLLKNDRIVINSNGTCETLNFFRNYYAKNYQHIANQFVNEFYFNPDNLENTDDFISENLYCLSNCGKAQINSLKSAINPAVFRIFLLEIQKYIYKKEILENERLLYGLVLHLSNLVNRKDNPTHSNNLESCEQLYPKEYAIATNIVNQLEDLFKFKIAKNEINFIASYIAITHNWINRTKVSLLIITHGDCIATDLLKNIKAFKEKDTIVEAIDFNENMQLNDLMELSLLKAKEINKGAGVIVAYDIEPLQSVSEYILTTEHIKSRAIANINMSSLLEIINKIESNQTIEQIVNTQNIKKEDKKDEDSFFINELVENFIKPNLSFLDSKKSVDNLFISLSNILADLSIPYSKEIGVKFLTHTVHMLERVIKKEPLSYPKLKSFMNNNKKLHYTVEKNLVNINELYGIFIPNDEIAYIMEIFLYL